MESGDGDSMPDSEVDGSAPKRRGPFAVDPVDPLVFQPGTDSPELRPAASYVAVAPQFRARMPKPADPSDATYQRWTPGGLPTRQVGSDSPPRGDTVGRAVEHAAKLVLFLLPALLIVASIWFASTQIGP